MQYPGSRLISYVCLFMVVSMFGTYEPAGQAQEVSQRVVIHLSHYSDDLHAVSMALKIGQILEDSGAEVTLFADLEGARVGDSRAPQNLRWGNGRPISELYEAFIDAGGVVVLCPHCAAAAGIGEGDLRDGSSISKQQEVAALFLAADKILDY